MKKSVNTIKRHWVPSHKAVGMVQGPYQSYTCPAQLRKNKRYEMLLEDCTESGWSAERFPVEVGWRGLIGTRLR